MPKADDRPSAHALQMETKLLSAPAARCCGLPDRTRGLLYALIAVTLVAPDAVLIRWMTELDGELFQIVAWKSLACAIFNIGLLLARGAWRAQLPNVRANAKPLLVLGVINTLVTSGFTLALALTVAARALLLTSLSPLWTALIGWLVLKDRLPRRTIAAVGFALLSVGVTFVPRLLTRDALTAPINAGDVIAFATGIMLSVSINTVRAFRKPYPKLPIPMIPISGGAILFPLATAVTVLRGHSLTSGLGARFVAPVVLIGVAIGGAYPFLYAAPKLITGAEISMVMYAARRSGLRALRAQASRAPCAQANEPRLRPRQPPRGGDGPALGLRRLRHGARDLHPRRRRAAAPDAARARGARAVGVEADRRPDPGGGPLRLPQRVRLVREQRQEQQRAAGEGGDPGHRAEADVDPERAHHRLEEAAAAGGEAR